MTQLCNLCGGVDFAEMGSRKGVRCVRCGSLERTRVLQLLLEKLQLIRPGIRVMHIAPERGIYEKISATPNIQYELYDLFPSQYPYADVKRLDLVEDCENLPSNHYDVVLHSHVIEHVPCDATSVFFHLQRSLKETGTHVFSVPILSGHFEECLGGINDEERTRRFGQPDHVRRFGVLDIQKTLGMLFHLPAEYDLSRQFDKKTLDKHNIPNDARFGFTSSSVFAMTKCQFKLRSN